MTPFDPSRPMSLQECINVEPFTEINKEDKRVDRLSKFILNYRTKNVATHAAGVVIADKN